MVAKVSIFLKVLVAAVNRATAFIRQCAGFLDAQKDAPAGGEGVVDGTTSHNPNAIVAGRTAGGKEEVEAAIRQLADCWTSWNRKGGAR